MQYAPDRNRKRRNRALLVDSSGEGAGRHFGTQRNPSYTDMEVFTTLCHALNCVGSTRLATPNRPRKPRPAYACCRHATLLRSKRSCDIVHVKSVFRHLLGDVFIHDAVNSFDEAASFGRPRVFCDCKQWPFTCCVWADRFAVSNIWLGMEEHEASVPQRAAARQRRSAGGDGAAASASPAASPETFGDMGFGTY